MITKKEQEELLQYSANNFGSIFLLGSAGWVITLLVIATGIENNVKFLQVLAEVIGVIFLSCCIGFGFSYLLCRLFKPYRIKYLEMKKNE